ncbi:beta-ketoacyl-[acyl-carrier-protein] synthase family protein [Aporhodopirellula aestuarii]|uniref:Beta-ketoacyl-[acyl-carrier-protein] synthase family protein n=1 Tax=Aporhodopirellula aestuarii TaxID=2950107 RepID=A0ABT0U454_9BACT|nr:beta-ketoacyl synthase N-terminal-like domain-containing protein [Aporhodopirellula aestuarii]MCM2371658.1 beta-ketoacyl-[acyl-carrier-protein] synthase family protein [Aporhodopirellula aestuarii]
MSASPPENSSAVDTSAVSSGSARRPVSSVVITGLGVISPLGNTPDELLEALHAGQSGIAPFKQVPTEAFSTSHGAEATAFTGHINDYGPLEKALQRTIRKGSKVMCREIEMGVASAQLALYDAGFNSEVFDRDRIGVLFGSDYIMSLPEEYTEGIAACIEDGKFNFAKWGQSGLPKVNPLWLLKYLPNMPASHIAIYNDLRGPNNSLTLREASSCAAIAEATSTILRGHADALVVGATGSRIHPLRTLHASLQETLAADREPCSEMSRPFDATRDGSVLGEGAASMLCESREHALARGATILGEVLGYGTSAVGESGGPRPIQIAIANALRATLRSAQNAGLGDVPIGHIHAHGLSDVDVDRDEAAAICEVFGDSSSQPPVTTAKGHFGNLGAGSGMVEIIASLKSLGANLFPIRNLQSLADDCPINAVTESGVSAGDSFISVNVTPQGQAAAVWIRREG